MARLDEQDKRRIYVVRKTAEDIKLGSWADCETIYNLLSPESRSQDTLSRVYRQLDKAEMSSITRTPEWDATRAQVGQWLFNKRVRGLDESSFRGSELDEEQPVSPDPMRTLSYPLETWERVMQSGPDDGSSVLQDAPQWFKDLGSTVEQSVSETSQSYASASASIPVDFSASAASAGVTYGSSVHAYSGSTSGFSDAYSGALDGFSDANPDLLSLDEPEALDSLTMSTYGCLTTQALSQQQTDISTTATFDQSFAEAAQRAVPTLLSGQAQHAAYNDVGVPSSYAGATMPTHVAVDDIYVDRPEHRPRASPALGTSTISTELEQLTGHTPSEMLNYDTPHFPDFPNLSIEEISQVDMLAWDNTQITLSLNGLEQLLAEKEFDPSCF